MDGLKFGVDILFLLIGVVMVFVMYVGFVFFEFGMVCKKN